MKRVPPLRPGNVVYRPNNALRMTAFAQDLIAAMIHVVRARMLTRLDLDHFKNFQLAASTLLQIKGVSLCFSESS